MFKYYTHSIDSYKGEIKRTYQNCQYFETEEEIFKKLYSDVGEKIGDCHCEIVFKDYEVDDFDDVGDCNLITVSHNDKIIVSFIESCSCASIYFHEEIGNNIEKKIIFEFNSMALSSENIPFTKETVEEYKKNKKDPINEPLNDFDFEIIETFPYFEKYRKHFHKHGYGIDVNNINKHNTKQVLENYLEYYNNKYDYSLELLESLTIKEIYSILSENDKKSIFETIFGFPKGEYVDVIKKVYEFEDINIPVNYTNKNCLEIIIYQKEKQYYSLAKMMLDKGAKIREENVEDIGGTKKIKKFFNKIQQLT